MKKEQRAPYVALCEIPFAGEILTPLCAFCKYGGWGGGCEDGYYQCGHPLFDKSYHFEDMAEGAAEGEDCWGFRPSVSFEVAHGMVENFKQGKGVILLDDLLLKRGR